MPDHGGADAGVGERAELRDLLQSCRDWLNYAYHNVSSVTSAKVYAAFPSIDRHIAALSHQPAPVAANASAEQWATELPDGSVSFDAYAGWSRDQLKDRCLELVGRIEQLECAANASAEARLREAPLRQRLADIICENYECPPDGYAETEPWNGGALEIIDMILEEIEHDKNGGQGNRPSHVVCVGMPTLYRLAAGEAVWIDAAQAGVVAADDFPSQAILALSAHPHAKQGETKYEPLDRSDGFVLQGAATGDGQHVVAVGLPKGPATATNSDRTADVTAKVRSIIRGIYGIGDPPYGGGFQDNTIDKAVEKIVAVTSDAFTVGRR
jgi:hypothetical protein